MDTEIAISYEYYSKISVVDVTELVENKRNYITICGVPYIDRVYQNNAQLIILCKPVSEPSESHCELIIKNIPRYNLRLFEMIKTFVNIGRTYNIRLMMDFSGSNRGFCFVKFYTPQFAEEALRLLNNFEIRPGTVISAQISLEQSRLFIGQIPKDLKLNELLSVFSPQLTNMTKCVLFGDVNCRSYNRGFGYVDFQNHHSASIARKIIPHIMFVHWGVINPIINWAIPEIKVPDAIMSKVRTVFVRGLYKDITLELLKNLVFRIVPPSSILKITHNGHFAYIKASSRCVAQTLIDELNGYTYFDAELEAAFARPKSYSTNRPASDRMHSFFYMC